MARPKLKDRTVLDWLRFTIPYKYDESDCVTVLSANNNKLKKYKVDGTSTRDLLYSIVNVLGLDGINYTNASVGTLEKLESASYGYTGTFVLGHCRIMYREPTEYMALDQIRMGICVELSSHALRDIEQSVSFTGWIDFFGNIRDFFPDARFTRIDIASDFFRDLKWLSAEGFHRLLKTKRFTVCLNSKSLPRFQGSVKNYKDIAETVYIRRPTSSYMLRIYNKFDERINFHGDVWLKKNNIKHWTRWEIQYNSDSAPQVADQIMLGVNPATIWHDTICQLISVQVPASAVGTNQKKKFVKVPWRKPRARKAVSVWVPVWWYDFIDAEHIPVFDITGKQPHYTYDKHMSWIGRCVLPTMVKDLLVQIVQGGDLNAYLNHVLSQGLSKLTPKDVDDVLKYAKQIRASKFYKLDNQFDFTQAIEGIADKFTGMAEARIYERRNEAVKDMGINNSIAFVPYDDYLHRHGSANNKANLKGTGVI